MECIDWLLFIKTSKVKKLCSSMAQRVNLLMLHRYISQDSREIMTLHLCKTWVVEQILKGNLSNCMERTATKFAYVLQSHNHISFA